MTQTPSLTTGGIVSARSRRLRTIGLVLLGMILLLSLYGCLRLVPSLRIAQARVHALNAGAQTPIVRTSRAVAAARANEPQALLRAQKVLYVKVLALYAYWTAVTLLVVALLVVAWLDFREVVRQYANRRRALWTDAIESTRRKNIGGDGSSRN